MERHTATEGMAQQHHRTLPGLGAHLIGQPAAVARQAWLEPPGPRPPTEAGKIGTPARQNGFELVPQRIPETAGKEPAMHRHEQGNGGIPSCGDPLGR